MSLLRVGTLTITRSSLSGTEIAVGAHHRNLGNSCESVLNSGSKYQGTLVRAGQCNDPIMYSSRKGFILLSW